MMLLGDVPLLLSPLACFWSNTAPRLYDEASADTMVSWPGSNRSISGLLLISSLTFTNAFCCGSSLHHWFLLDSKSRRGLVSSARCLENFPSWLVMPKKRRMSPMHVGVWRFRIADTLSGSGLTPNWSAIWPKHFTLGWENSLFLIQGEAYFLEAV